MHQSSGFVLFFVIGVLEPTCLQAQVADSNARPPVTNADIDIAKRAARILNSPAKWNRADNRVCPSDAKAFSLYCALEKATEEVGKSFENRAAVMEETRSIIEEIAPDVDRYSHWLADYNNDPNTDFTDIQGVFWLLEKHIAMRLGTPQPTGPTAVTKADLQVARRVRELLHAPEQWNRSNIQCLADARTFSLRCAFEKAEKEVTGVSGDGEAIREARAIIRELDSGHKYSARLIDYNADTAVSFADLQNFLRQLEDRLAARLGAQ